MQERSDAEKNIAVCYLFKDGDHKNRCVLTSRNLVITYRHSDYFFPLESLLSFGIERRRLLLPVVAGGIFVPLIFIACMGYRVSPVILFILIMAGVLMFYYGWNGAEVLVITASNQSFQCPFRAGSAGIVEFVSYVNSLLKGNNSLELLYYVTIPDNISGEEKIGHFIEKYPDRVNIYSFRNIMSLYTEKALLGEQKLYSFDPVTSGIGVKYLQTGQGVIIHATWPQNLKDDVLRFAGSIRDFYNRQTGKQI